MTETLEKPPESDSVQERKFPGINETRESLSELASKPPSPMPIPNQSERAVNEPLKDTAQQFAIEPNAKSFGHLKDYKKRGFDPRLHKVKADGTPELTKEGFLKILPKSKRGIVDTVKSIFSVPKSDHEITEEQEASAHAQAKSVMEIEEMEAGAEFWMGAYFMFGNTVASSGFSSNKSDREDSIRRLFLNYEKKTGKVFDPPPGMALALGLSMDFATTVATVPECRERLDLYTDAVVQSAVKGAVRKTWFGRSVGKFVSFFGGGNAPVEAKPRHAVQVPSDSGS